MYDFALPERCKILSATPTTTTNATVTYDNVCLKNVHKAWLLVYYLMPQGHATTIQPLVGATDAGCTNSITFSAKWWRNATTGTTDTLSAQTAATSMAASAVSTNQIVLIEIDPADVAAQDATYDWLGASSATSSQSTDYVTAFWILEMRYQQATPPAVIA